jgi:hypothetical protein
MTGRARGVGNIEPVYPPSLDDRRAARRDVHSLFRHETAIPVITDFHGPNRSGGARESRRGRSEFASRSCGRLVPAGRSGLFPHIVAGRAETAHLPPLRSPNCGPNRSGGPCESRRGRSGDYESAPAAGSDSRTLRPHPQVRRSAASRLSFFPAQTGKTSSATTTAYQLRSGNRDVALLHASKAQEALIEYLRSYGCADDDSFGSARTHSLGEERSTPPRPLPQGRGRLRAPNGALRRDALRRRAGTAQIHAACRR